MPHKYLTNPTWEGSRYSSEKSVAGRHYKIDTQKLEETHPGSITPATITSDVLNIIEQDLMGSYQEALLSSFARHVVFVYDTINISSSVYEKPEFLTNTSAWDFTKKMYYDLADKYECYSFSCKVTLAKPNSLMLPIEHWPVYIEFNHTTLEKGFKRLKYVYLCECETRRSTDMLDDACKIYCVNKHANITSRYYSTRELFSSNKDRHLYSNLLPSNPDVISLLKTFMPNDSERAMHLQAALSGEILERVDEITVASLPHHSDISYFRDMVTEIGVPDMRDLCRPIGSKVLT